jgi:hypothetical protein
MLLSALEVFRIVPIQGPFERVISNIPPDEVEGSFVTHDVFVIIPLPDGYARSAALQVDAAG